MERSHRLVGGHQDERPHRLAEHAVADVEQTRQRLTARVLGVGGEVLARILEHDDTPALRPSRGSARVGDRIEEVARVREELLRIGHELELRPGAPLAHERSDRVGLAGAGFAVPEHETSARRRRLAPGGDLGDARSSALDIVVRDALPRRGREHPREITRGMRLPPPEAGGDLTVVVGDLRQSLSNAPPYRARVVAAKGSDPQ